MTRPMFAPLGRVMVIAMLISSAMLDSPAVQASTPRFTDIASSPFRADIEWLAARGVVVGCAPDRYCPTAVMTREQMASMLARMLDLPPTADDYFADDEGTQHEADINRAAAAGLTGGCGAERFCPRALVTRAQMASFVARAGRLPPAGADYFLGDENSIHEGDINRAAAAGITAGCAKFVFCFAHPVTRGQMAAFLHRLEQPIGPPLPLPEVGALPTCRHDDVLTKHTDPEDWSRSLLDTIYMLPASYPVLNLVDTGRLGLNAGYRVRSILADDLRAMASAARRAGAPIALASGYRSYEAQIATFDYWVAQSGYHAALLRSARPGHSEHQLGTTIDVRSAGGADPWRYRDWAATAAGAWMRDNAWRYGFVMSYPRNETATTCYDYEPWHYRYVGRATARAIWESGLTLREWLWRLGHGS